MAPSILEMTPMTSKKNMSSGDPDLEAFPGQDLDPEAILTAAQVGQGLGQSQDRNLGQNPGRGLSQESDLTLRTFQGDEDRLHSLTNGE